MDRRARNREANLQRSSPRSQGAQRPDKRNGAHSAGKGKQARGQPVASLKGQRF